MMASVGILGEYKGSQAREVIMTLDEYEQMCKEAETTSKKEPAQSTQASDSDYAVEGERSYVSLDQQDE